MIQPQELYPGVSVATLSGMLSFKNHHYILHPHPHTVAKQLWGQPSLDGIIKALREVRMHPPTQTHPHSPPPTPTHTHTTV